MLETTERYLDTLALRVAMGTSQICSSPQIYADVNLRGDGNQTPLHLALRAGYLRTVELLVKRKTYIHVRNNEGRTPFEEASVKGHRNIMQLSCIT